MAQGKSTGRVRQAVEAVKGYARGSGISGAVNAVKAGASHAASYATASNAKSAGRNVATAVRNAVATVRSYAANAKARSTRRRTTLQLGSGK
ncbi:MAG: hypothetical protein E6R03_06135 [Hyphomicrobiaceae bacterium]|nr:MAG: hypothetical protein E6R03_06135 [Hyphomicrobiaceae bacterium]